MSEKNPFEIEFDEYIREVEPAKKEKADNWACAIGLQQVDGLTPSKYLFETARRNIEGEISIEEVKNLIHSYYEYSRSRDASLKPLSRFILLEKATQEPHQFLQSNISAL